ncbi:2-4-dienoyl-CoA reductase [Dacryopinax primogenitus]|uniref:2,4-dienoyl-CoA reductase [(3E)-enoyl-CoA-producing] n=1 Tax=Dacryopinax primogenitus (strain DJM 731) TaxID=1858805 RepID=M5G008_DACPD|nr:2-4-dienoyl-CoA reductase [Dacryopinax primogenitus]EJT99141.1 2-4-dienoyl-CoA reductase [Dacryopinax primogenitus]
MSSTNRVPPPPVPDPTKIFQRGLFKGKVVLATGGGSGIVMEMVKALMQLGADAIIISRSKEKIESSAADLSRETGQKCVGFSADVRSPAQLKEAVDNGVKELGKIDFVICGAAGNFLAPISALSENAFKTVIDIDTLGTYNTVKATMEHVKRTHGAYIHVSATLHYRGLIYQAHASAAKAAVDALSQVIAVELGPFGVRSNIVAPGAIMGTVGMNKLSKKKDGEDQMGEAMLGRWGEKSDISSIACYLFSDAGAWITGQKFVVDGGELHMPPQMTSGNFPYPQAVVDPASVVGLIKSRL